MAAKELNLYSDEGVLESRTIQNVKPGDTIPIGVIVGTRFTSQFAKPHIEIKKWYVYKVTRYLAFCINPNTGEHRSFNIGDLVMNKLEPSYPPCSR